LDPTVGATFQANFDDLIFSGIARLPYRYRYDTPIGADLPLGPNPIDFLQEQNGHIYLRLMVRMNQSFEFEFDCRQRGDEGGGRYDNTNRGKNQDGTPRQAPILRTKR